MVLYFLYYFNTQYKIVNARYPTPVTSSLPPPNITLEMMVKNQYKGILKSQYTSLVDNKRMCLSLIDNARPRAFPAGVFFIIPLY